MKKKISRIILAALIVFSVLTIPAYAVSKLNADENNDVLKYGLSIDNFTTDFDNKTTLGGGGITTKFDISGKINQNITQAGSPFIVIEDEGSTVSDGNIAILLGVLVVSTGAITILLIKKHKEKNNL